MDTILGLLMYAGSIFCSVYMFGGWRESPKWLQILAGVFNILLMVAAFIISVNSL